MDEFKLNLHSQIVVAWKITNFILVILTPFSRSQEGSDCWIMACLHAVCWMNGRILTKLAQLFCWDRDKNWLDFLWPWSHFQGYTGAMILENGLSAPCLIEEWMNFDQTYILVYCDLEFIIDTIYFNIMSVQFGGGTFVFLRKHCSCLSCF